MKSFKFTLIYFLKLIARYRITILAIFVLLAICTAIGIYINKKATHPTISQGIVGTYTEDDLPLLITRLLSQSLINIDEKGAAVPNLVSHWDVSEDTKVYKFYLKDNLFWSDGTAIKASDLTFSLPDVQYEALDDRTLQFKLADSFSPFPTLLNKPILKKNTRIGVGPYKVTNIYKDIVFIKKIILTANSPDFPTITARFYPNEKIAKNALKIGEVQSVMGVNELGDMTVKKPFAVYSTPQYGRLVTIFYNTQDPILSDENLRLALSFAAPKIADEQEAQTPINPNSWAFNSAVKDYLANPDQAKQYLAKAQKGKPDEKSNVAGVATSSANQTITLTAISSLKSIGEQVVKGWNDVGIKARLLVESGIPQNFQALLITQNIPADPDQYSLWHKLGQTNISKFSSPRVDKDLEDGRKIADVEQRKAKYQDFQKVLMDNAPATFLYFPKYNVLYLEKIEENLKKVLDIQLKNF